MLSYSECGNKGVIEKTVNQEVKVPKGVESGAVLKILKMGNGGGNLLVKIKILSHPYFKRKGFDIHTDKLITITQAVLGSKLDITTLYGKKSIEIKPGTAPGSIFIIPKYGIKKPNTNSKTYGDHHVHINVKIPSSLSKKQRDMLEEYAEIESRILSDDPHL